MLRLLSWSGEGVRVSGQEYRGYLLYRGCMNRFVVGCTGRKMLRNFGCLAIFFFSGVL